MRLGIISDCLHVENTEGSIGTDNHIFVRQMEALAEKFSSVTICCPFVEYNKNVPITTYSNPKFSFIKLDNSGGNTFSAKLHLIKQFPVWFKGFKKINQVSDIVYQRFPNNLNIPGFFYFWLKGKKVFGTYTGTWGKSNDESLSYKFQKWLLKYFFKGPVGVYSTSENLGKRIFKSFSPSYSLQEWNEEIENVEQKVKGILKNGISALSMITVGSFIGYKNQQYILDTCLQLKERNIPFHLLMVGDGMLMEQYKNFIKQNNLQQQVTITGKLKYTDVRILYRKVNFVVQAPTLEGFGKVPIEGYFHGALPIINNITMANYLTENGKIGYLFSVQQKEDLLKLLLSIYENPQQVSNRIKEGRKFVKHFTLENWRDEYYEMINKRYNNILR